MPNQLGKMYICTKCNAQVIVTKAGNGSLQCCGQPMEQKKEMPRVRAVEGREAGWLTRLVQAVFRAALGRELNPYKVEAHAPRAVLSSFLSNTVMTTAQWMLGGDLRQLGRGRFAARSGCPF